MKFSKKIDFMQAFQVIVAKMEKGVQRYLVVRNECANKNFTTQFVEQLFEEEGKGEVGFSKI